MKTKQNIDIVITGNVAWLDIAWSPKILYGLIRGLTRNDNYCCYATNAYLAEKLEVENESTVRRYLTKLKSLGVVYCTDGYITAEDGNVVYRHRLIVLSELRKKFEKQQDLLRDLNNKSRTKKCSLPVQNCTPEPVQNCTGDRNKVLPCKNNYIYSNNKERINPQPPCKGANKAVEQTEQYLALGKYQNVRLTEFQKGELVREFGSDLVLSLIEQLSCYIQSRRRRFRADTDYFALLQDWCLRRLERKGVGVGLKQALVGDIDIRRHVYAEEELNSLFTKLDIEPDDGSE